MSKSLEKRKYLVVNPKHAIKVQLQGQAKAKLQNVPKGTEVYLDDASAKTAVAAGKLKLYAAEEAPSEGEENSEEIEELTELLEEAEAETAKVKKELTKVKKELTAAKKAATAASK